MGMEDNFGISCIAVSLGLTTIYHVLFFGRVALTNSWDIQFSDNFLNNAIWTIKHREKHDAQTVTLAVQALRNTTVAGIFVGSYAVQFGLSAGTLCAHSTLVEVQIGEGMVALFMFLSFLSWSTVIRASVHLGFHIDTLSYLHSCVHSSQEQPSSTIHFDFISEHMEAGTLQPDERGVSVLIPLIQVKMAYCQRLLSFITIFFRYSWLVAIIDFISLNLCLMHFICDVCFVGCFRTSASDFVSYLLRSRTHLLWSGQLKCW